MRRLIGRLRQWVARVLARLIHSESVRRKPAPRRRFFPAGAAPPMPADAVIASLSPLPPGTADLAGVADVCAFPASALFRADMEASAMSDPAVAEAPALSLDSNRETETPENLASTATLTGAETDANAASADSEVASLESTGPAATSVNATQKTVATADPQPVAHDASIYGPTETSTAVDPSNPSGDTAGPDEDRPASDQIGAVSSREEDRQGEPRQAAAGGGQHAAATAPASRPVEEVPVPARRSFRIENATPPYQPEVRERPAFAADPEFRASSYERVDAAYALYLRPRARREIQEHIAWGERMRRNLVEQGGILLGRAYRDPRDGTIWAEVETAVPGASAQGSAAFVEFGHHTWGEMLHRVDRLGDIEGGTPQVIGWYHTHPGELSVFMSGTDRATQRRMFYADWHFAMVLNPQKRVWRVFHGAACVECLGCAVRPEQSAAELATGLVKPLAHDARLEEQS
jgi:hypothetical protein